jgi:hypothetical protein
MNVEWGALFRLSVVFLWLLFSVVIKRRIGAIGMADLLVLVIIRRRAERHGRHLYLDQRRGWLAFRFAWLQRLIHLPHRARSQVARAWRARRRGK